MAALSRGSRIRAIVTGSAGNLVEWFDFYAYAFTSIYFAAAFFPIGDRTAQLLSVAGIYAAGFLMRPLGGWFFGRYSDRHGRKAGMVASVALMGVASLAIAASPTYAQAGILAPSVLLLARLAQGFSTGGQYGAAATYLSEIATASSRGLYASLHFVTLIAGQLFALIVVLLLQAVFRDSEIRAWAWRIPFVVGAAISMLLLMFRNHMHETVSSAAHLQGAGTMRALLHYPRSLMIVVVIAAAGGITLYTFTTYMQKFLVNTAGMTVEYASGIMTAALVVFMLMQPVLGSFSDRIGRRASLIIFGALMSVSVVPIMTALSSTSSAIFSFILVSAAMLGLSFYTSVSGLFKAELFPPHVRCLGVGLAHSVSTAVFGGTTEFVALLFKRAGREHLFFWYVSVFCLIALLTAIVMREPRRSDMMAMD